MCFTRYLDILSRQSDLPSESSRNLVKQALKDAAKQVRRSTARVIAVDRDTKGEPGTPAAANTILRKITNSDVFVSDASIITNSRSWAAPNPNVLFELGFAAAALGWERVIGVRIRATGWHELALRLGSSSMANPVRVACSSTPLSLGVIERRKELLEGHQAAVQRGETHLEFPGVRFYLLHSLSHLLMTAISLECGYSTSAIRERIYCAGSDPNPDRDRVRRTDQHMAAILLSTGTPGSEGTLGGLVGQGRVLHEHLRRAWLRAELCANDPVCASHSPRGDHSERFLEGAACHGCLYVAEPSCERFNRYLDRALVVPTLGHDPELAFFGRRP